MHLLEPELADVPRDRRLRDPAARGCERLRQLELRADPLARDDAREQPLSLRLSEGLHAPSIDMQTFCAPAITARRRACENGAAMETPSSEKRGLGAAARIVSERASSIVRLELQLAAAELKKKVASLGIGIAPVRRRRVPRHLRARLRPSRRSPPRSRRSSPTWLALLIVTGGLFAARRPARRARPAQAAQGHPARSRAGDRGSEAHIGGDPQWQPLTRRRSAASSARERAELAEAVGRAARRRRAGEARSARSSSRSRRSAQAARSPSAS